MGIVQSGTVKNNGGHVCRDCNVINTVVDIEDFVFFNVGEGDRVNGKESEWVGGKDGEGLIGMGNVGVPNAFRELHNHKFANRVLYGDAIGDTIFVEGEITVGGDGGDRVEYKIGGGKGGRGSGQGVVNIVYDVVRGGSELESGDFKGHVTVAWEAGERIVRDNIVFIRGRR